MLHNFAPPSVMLLAFTLLTGVAYPLAITGIAWVMLQDQALGSLIEKDGKVVGSSLIGQAFTSAQLLPSASVGDHGTRSGRCLKTVDAPYNAAASTGSNLGPITKKLLDRVKGSVESCARKASAAPSRSMP